MKEAKAAHLSGIETFAKDKLKDVEPVEKVPLPTAEEFALDQQPKKAYAEVKAAAAAFDKSQLKPAQTHVKHDPS